MPDLNETSSPLAEVGRYARLAEARERGLVVAARDLPYWIEREGDAWVLRVEERSREEATRELAAYEIEEKEKPAPLPVLPHGRVAALSLYVVAWLLGSFFFLQQMQTPRWEDLGAADSDLILQGQWWRTVTALTLHGDFAHVGMNLGCGLLFAVFALPRLGTGVTWMAILLTGVLGNGMNAWGYRGDGHAAIGASTACFGALGLLMGMEFYGRWREPQTRSWWQMVLPLGAGLGMLAFFGTGEEGKHIDFMAHGWGFVVGGVLGLFLEAVRIRERLSVGMQRALAAASLAAIFVAWLAAWQWGKSS